MRANSQWAASPVAVFAAVAFSLLSPGCDPGGGAPLPFIELTSTTGESDSYLIPSGGSVSRGSGQYQASGRTQSVTYAIGNDRHVPFLIDGDIINGATDDALQLPSVDPDGSSRTVDVSAFDPDKWRSFAVYDRGLCSVQLPWPTLGLQFTQAITAAVEGSNRISNTAFVRSSLTPVIRQTPSANGLAPSEERGLVRFEYDFTGSASLCDTGNFSATMEISLAQTNYHNVQMSAVAYAIACNYGVHLPGVDLIGSEHELTGQSRIIDRMCRSAVGGLPWDCTGRPGIVPRGVIIELREYMQRIADGESTACEPGARIAGYDLTQADFVGDYDNLYRHRGGNRKVVLGYSNYNGQQIGARDVVGDIESMSVDVSSCGILNGAIANGVEDTFRDQIPFAVRDALIDALVVDPVLMGLDSTNCAEEDGGAPPIDPCSFLGENGPAFAGDDGVANGGRHRCAERRSDRYAAFGEAAVILVDAVDNDDVAGNPACEELRQDDYFCHYSIEPRRVNVRPDGLEVVIADSDANVQLGDIQASLANGALCSADRNGSGIPATAGPTLISYDAPYEFTPSDIPPPAPPGDPDLCPMP